MADDEAGSKDHRRCYCGGKVKVIGRAIYWFYPIIWSVPPIHEVGHIFICWLYGAEVFSINMVSITHAAAPNTTMRLAHMGWDVASLLFVVIAALPIYLYLYRMEKKL